MDVVWGSEKALANLKKHGVDFADAAIALEDENALTISDNEHGEFRFKTLAISPSVEVLLIVHAERDKGTIRIISARKAMKSEQRQYFQGVMR